MTILLDKETGGAVLPGPRTEFPVLTSPGVPISDRAGFGEAFVAGSRLGQLGAFFGEAQTRRREAALGLREPGFIGAFGGTVDDPSYSIANDPRLKDNLALQSLVLGSRSFDETTLRLFQLREEQADMETLNSSAPGEVMRFMNEMLSMDALVGAGLVRSATRLRNVGKAVGATMAIAIPEEALRSAHNETRMVSESLSQIGSIALVAGTWGYLVKPRRGTADVGFGSVRFDDSTGGASGMYLGGRPEGPAPGGGSVGAAEAENPWFRKSYEELLWEEGLKETGTGIEKGAASIFPVFDILESASLQARQLITEVVDPGGLIKNKNVPTEGISMQGTAREAQETRHSVEVEQRTKWLYPLVKALRLGDRFYLRYLGVKPTDDVADFLNVNFGTMTGGRGGLMSIKRFREEGGRAMRRGDQHSIPEVQSMAHSWRRLLNRINKEATDLGVYTREMEGEIDNLNALKARATARAEGKTQFDEAQRKQQMDNLQAKIDELTEKIDNFGEPTTKRARDHLARLERELSLLFGDLGRLEEGLPRDPSKPKSRARQRAEAEAAELQREIDITQSRIDRVLREGPTTNTADSYFPRIWKHDVIHARRDELEGIIARDMIARLGDDAPPMQQAVLQAGEIVETILGQNPYFEPQDELAKASDNRRAASAALRRTLEIRDELVEDFLESDVEVVMRYVSQSMTKDIELTRRFGDLSMTDQIKAVSDEYDELIAAASGEKRIALRKEKKRIVQKVRDIRDRFRGTYGVPSDPMKPVSRAIRIAKIFNVLTLMQGAAISSIPDLGRIVMTEGFLDTVRVALGAYNTDISKTIRSMSRRDLNSASVGLEFALGARSMAMADISDTFGRRDPLERTLFEASNTMFMLNGLTWWNNAMKEIAGTVISDRLLRSAIQWSKNEASRKTIMKLTRSGIDPGTAVVIAQQFKKHGETLRTVHLANLAKWDKEAAQAAKKYRMALNQDVDRTILTPGAGDRALFASTEIGSLIFQFWSFGQATIPRTIVSGLQEESRSFLQGAFLMIGLGAMTEQIKRDLRGDTRERDMNEIIVDAIDRSGILGVMSNIDTNIDILSDGRLGLRAMVGVPPSPSSGMGKTGVFLGPTGVNLDRITNLISDVASGQIDEGTVRTLDRLVPGSQLPWVQAMDISREAGFELPTGEP